MTIPEAHKITAARAKPIAERAREVHSAHAPAEPPEFSLVELLADPSRVFVARTPVAQRPRRMRRRTVEIPQVPAPRACHASFPELDTGRRNGWQLPAALDHVEHGWPARC